MINRLAAALLALFLITCMSPAQAQQACPNPFVAGAPCTPITATATGTTGAVAATLPAVAGKTTYICGFYYTGTNATAANGPALGAGATQATVTAWGYYL